ncbi:MAG: GNAT family N-acetyltransferase [Chloroflexi bacterium]|nr:GNAT family N-acetyltransferase [Chloroflexota bacterium]
MDIIPYSDTNFSGLVQFIARMNGRGAHHIGYFGLDAVDIEHGLQDITPPLTETFRLVFDQGELVGVLGAEYDAEINRAWLYGPLIDHPEWHVLADRLYEQVCGLIPSTIGEYEIFCDAENRNCQLFSARHGFRQHGDHAIYSLPRTRPIPAGAAAAWEPCYFEQFDALHKQAFPHAYYTSQQIIEKLDDHTRLWLAAANGDLQGYVFGKTDPEANAGYIDFIAVDERYRGQHIGKTLLAAAIGEMFSNPAVQKVDLTVNASNVAAVRLYDSFGFERERTMRAFRKGG